MHFPTMFVLQFCILLSSISLALSQGVFPGKDDSCFDPPREGNCKAFHPSFYFNVNAGYCDCFVYTGCRGNGNRFRTLKECMHTCGVRTDQQIITNKCRNTFKGTQQLRDMLREFVLTVIQPTSQFDARRELVPSSQVTPIVERSCFDVPLPGRCKAFIPSFYYNVNAGYCDCFIYSGCDGNSNRFESYRECMNSCGVRRQEQIVSETCKKHLRGTRQLEEMLNDIGGENKKIEAPQFAADDDRGSRPESSNPEREFNCQASLQAGNCKAFIPSFYYNTNAGYCDCFIYTGCGGNSNRFDSHGQCMNSCGVRREEQIVSESCKRHFRGTRQLEMMLNDFSSNNKKTETPQFAIDEEKWSRPRPVTSIPERANNCFASLQPGDCKAFLPSFYYNVNAGYCDCFVYSGCGGNSNRFDTLQECIDACGVRRDKQVISTGCKEMLQGTQLLDKIVREFGRNNQNDPQIDIRGSTKRNPPSPSDIKEAILVATASLPPPPRPPAPSPSKSSSDVPSFFQAAKHPWQ